MYKIEQVDLVMQLVHIDYIVCRWIKKWQNLHEIQSSLVIFTAGTLLLLRLRLRAV